MKAFDEIAYGFAQCRKEVGEFAGLLSSRDELAESADVLLWKVWRPRRLKFGNSWRACEMSLIRLRFSEIVEHHSSVEEVGG